MAPQNGPTGTQEPSRPWDKLQTIIRNSIGLPEGRFGGSKHIPTNLRGTFTENRDRSDSRTPQDIQGALRKSRAQVPRPPRANDPRSRATSQRSPAGQKGNRNECQDAQRAIGDRGTLNSTPNVQTGKTDSRGAESPERSFTRRMAILGSFKSSFRQPFNPPKTALNFTKPSR
ncbi:hypothetical protein CDL15_Pgr005045 [Punica granatum]|uniref:Uncharacterized protein n=1 Tax=Punica granatum TaxID=22663 RepID=A0A218XIV7_PUNGR|nr:hypothetical protein CDL15_Pgr005045 [Punica granatum]